MWITQTILFFITLYVKSCYGDFCYSCTTNLDCGEVKDCGFGVGCFKQVTIFSNQKYLVQDCEKPSCQEYENNHCTEQNFAECCQGDYCNYYDPSNNWRPRQPTPITIKRITGTSTTVSWSQRCNVYTYVVDYYIHSTIAGRPSAIYNSTSSELYIYNLYPQTTYAFVIWAFYDRKISLPSQFIITTTELQTTVTTLSPTLGRQCWRNVGSIENSGELQKCPNADDVCYGRLHYSGQGKKSYVTSGCQEASSCAEDERDNNVNCKPGENGKFCHFCCSGSQCNTVSWTTSYFSCDAGEESRRINCGTEGIDEITCHLRGCCFDDDSSIPCYYSGLSSSSTSSSVISTASLSIGIIVAIVVAIIVLLLIIILIILCYIRRRREMKKGSYDVPTRAKSTGLRSVSRDVYDRTRISESNA